MAGEKQVRTLSGIATAVVMSFLWLTNHFGVAVWVLLAALTIRYLLYLFGDTKTRNPFVTLALYLGTAFLGHLALPQILSGQVSWTVVQAIVIAAAVYELRGLITDLGSLHFKNLPPSEVAQVKTDVADLKAMLAQVASMLQAQPQNPQASAAQVAQGSMTLGNPGSGTSTNQDGGSSVAP